MKPECLPFSQIPHTTRLFADFLSYPSPVHQFYPHSPYFNQWVKDEAATLRFDANRREHLSKILLRQNEAWRASNKTLENIARLRSGALAAVTGQQVGLFGGPAFAIYKALTAAKLAELATRQGVDCVPVFWLATEDHDLAEVNQVSLPGPDGSLQKFTSDPQGVAGAPVGTFRFGSEIESTVESLAAVLGESEALSALRQSYCPGETFGNAFARLFARILGDWGVILLDPSDPELHRIAEPIYRAAIERAGEFDDLLLARGKELEAAGYHQQVRVTESSTLVFAVRNGARIPIHRRATGNTSEFVIGEEKISQSDLLDQISAAPQDFNPNALLRPVVQDYLLPTLAYTGGSAEVAYFAQLAVVQKSLLGRVTPIIPRFSTTIIENKPASLLTRYNLNMISLFAGPEALQERLASHTLPAELQSAFDSAQTAMSGSMEAIRSALERLDKTLVEAAANAESKMQHQLEGLRARAARAELRQTEVLTRHAQLLSNLLYPNKELQEREVGGIYFLARYGQELLHDLYNSINPDCLDHQVITL